MKSAVEAAKTVKVSAEEAYSEVQRECQVRARCFDKWVEDGKLAWADARDRLARLGEAERMLKVLLDGDKAAIGEMLTAMHS